MRISSSPILHYYIPRSLLLLLIPIFQATALSSAHQMAQSDKDSPVAVKMILAIQENNAGKLKSLLAKHGSHYAKAPFRGASLLAQAVAYAGDYEDFSSLKLLLKHGADINALDERGNSVLEHAVKTGHVPVVEWLLEKGANPSLVGAQRANEQPIHSAAFLGNVAIIKLLIAHGADPNAINSDSKESPLHVIAGAEVEKWGPELGKLHEMRPKGVTPIKWFDAVGTTKALLEAGTQIDGLDSAGNEPLELAISKGNLDVAEVLVEHGADPLITYSEFPHVVKQRVRLSEWAKVHGYKDIMDSIRSKKPGSWRPVTDKNRGVVGEAMAESDAERLPLVSELIEAVRRNDSSAVRRLLEKHGDAYASESTFQDRTIAVMAVLMDRLAILQILVEHGADVSSTAKDKDGNTLLHHAASMGRTDIVQWLLTLAGVDPNDASNDGSRPIHLAALIANRPIIELLLKSGADPNAMDRNGRVALHNVAGATEKSLKKMIADNQLLFNVVKEKVSSSVYAFDPVGVVEALVEGGAKVDGTNKGGMGTEPLLGAAVRKNWPVVRALLAHGSDPLMTVGSSPGARDKQMRISQLAKHFGMPNVEALLRNEKFRFADSDGVIDEETKAKESPPRGKKKEAAGLREKSEGSGLGKKGVFKKMDDHAEL